MSANGRRAHVLAFGSRWPPETFVARRLESLAVAGHRVTFASVLQLPGDHRPIPGVDHVVALRGGERRLRIAAIACARLVRLAVRSPRRARRVWRAAGLPTAAGRPIGRFERAARAGAYAMASESHPDVVHFEWTSAAAHFASLPVALGLPYVVSCHGSELQVYPYTNKGSATSPALGTVLAGAAVVHCASERLASEACRRGLPPGRAVVIRAAVDPTVFRPPPERRRGDELRVVCVGALRWIKAFEYAVLAVARVTAAGVPVRLDIVGGDPKPDIGEPSDRERILAAVADLGLAGRVELRGQASQQQVLGFLQSADVFLQSSLSEGHPTAVVEAMACGLPVVATDVGGTREALQHGVEGFLVAPRDDRAAAAHLQILWHDAELAARMGRAARERVEAEFALDHQTARFSNLYEQAIAEALRCS